jgi:hypothetical protein
MGAGRRYLEQRVVGVRWSGPLAAERTREGSVLVATWGAGRRCVCLPAVWGRAYVDTWAGAASVVLSLAGMLFR